MIETIQSLVRESIQVKEAFLDSHINSIKKAAELWIECYQSAGKIMFCGNGGSASDSQHIATELMVRLKHNSNRPALAAIALTTDTSLLTAGGNDLGFNEIFARQVEGLGTENDLLIAISTSGNSPNILRAVEEAKRKKLKTIAFLGNDGGKLKELVDLALTVPHHDSGRIQESHIMLGHILCELTETHLYG